MGDEVVTESKTRSRLLAHIAKSKYQNQQRHHHDTHRYQPMGSSTFPVPLPDLTKRSNDWTVLYSDPPQPGFQCSKALTLQYLPDDYVLHIRIRAYSKFKISGKPFESVFCTLPSTPTPPWLLNTTAAIASSKQNKSYNQIPADIDFVSRCFYAIVCFFFVIIVISLQYLKIMPFFLEMLKSTTYPVMP